MRTFVLRRLEDVSGVSGTGVVAEGVEFTDGSVALHWVGEHKSTSIWDSLQVVKDTHGHGGKTQVVWIGPPVLEFFDRTYETKEE